jgi:hypothetical protein
MTGSADGSAARDGGERRRTLALVAVFAALVLFLVLLRSVTPEVADTFGSREHLEAVDLAPLVGPASEPVFSGELVDLEYRWQPGAGFRRLQWNYRVRVRLEDDRGNILAEDDHYPPVPTSLWRGEGPLVYERTVHLPECPEQRRVRVLVALYEKRRPYRKVRLVGEAAGDGFTLAGEFPMERARLTPPRVRFLDGWYNPEKDPDTGHTARWMGEEALCQVGNLRRDVDLFLKGGFPREPFARPSTITITLNGRPIDVFTPPYGDFSRRITLRAADLGERPSLLFGVQIDQTFTPSDTGIATDPRILGLYLEDFVVLPRLEAEV